MRHLKLLLYKLFFANLPATDGYFPGAMLVRKLRSSIAKSLFNHCGKNVNIEKGADFGTGKNISIGNNSGIGVNC